MEGNTSWTVVVSEDFALGFGQAYTDAGPSNFSVYYGDNGQHEFKAHIDTLVQAFKFFAWEFGIDLMIAPDSIQLVVNQAKLLHTTPRRNKQVVERMLEFCYTGDYEIVDDGEGTNLGRAEDGFLQHYHAARIAVQYGIKDMESYALKKLALFLSTAFQELIVSPATHSLQFLQLVVSTWYGSKKLVGHAPRFLTGRSDQPVLRSPISLAICKTAADIWADTDVTGPMEKVRIKKGLQCLCAEWEAFAAEFAPWMVGNATDFRLV